MPPLPPAPSAYALLAGRRLHLHFQRQLGDALSANGRPSPESEARPPSGQRERPGQNVASHLPSPAPAAPTVVFEAALGGSCLSWVHVQPALAGLAATLSYDRAGLGWSDPAPALAPALGLDAMAADLAAVLAQAGALAPLILVGHSFGSLVVSRFAALHPERVAGLVLVDPPSFADWTHPDPDNTARLQRGIRLARRGVWLAQCGIARFVAWLVGIGALRLAATGARWASGGSLRTQRDFNFAPATRLPPEWKPAMRWMWSRPRFYRALADQMEALPHAVRLVAASPPPPSIPLTVLSAADTPAAQRAEHEIAAARSLRGRHLVAASSGHWIPLEDPGLVIEAIRELLLR